MNAAVPLAGLHRPARLLTALAGYVVGCIVVGALLSWPLWQLFGLAGLLADDFPKLVLRVVQLCALLGVWPLARSLHLSARADLAMAGGPGYLAEMRNGILLGALGMAVLAAALLLLEVRVPREATDTAPLRLLLFALLVVLGALLLSLVEEAWFRGGLHGVLRRHLGIVPAALAGAVLFALMHYARADSVMSAAEVRWWSGLEVMRDAFDRLATRERIVDSLAGLAMFGLMLTALRERSGRLALAIGVHAGSVMVVRVLREYTRVDHEGPLAWLVGSFDGVMGWLAALWLLLLTVLVVIARDLPGAVRVRAA